MSQQPIFKQRMPVRFAPVQRRRRQYRPDLSVVYFAVARSSLTIWACRRCSFIACLNFSFCGKNTATYCRLHPHTSSFSRFFQTRKPPDIMTSTPILKNSSFFLLIFTFIFRHKIQNPPLRLFAALATRADIFYKIRRIVCQHAESGGGHIMFFKEFFDFFVKCSFIHFYLLYVNILRLIEMSILILIFVKLLFLI
nr:MAG TPA: hypothetical protein [Caudoviricetes sp.]